MKILTLSDVVLETVYGPQVRTRFRDVDLVVCCGDLPYYYIEYVISNLDKPTFFVRGNHAHAMEYSELGGRSEPHGGIDLHRRVICHRGLLLAGIEGSLRYNYGPFQYSQGEMFAFILGMVPELLLNKLRFGRYLDLFVTHAPPVGIHDMPDLPHRGVKAFRWVLKVFKPAYHFHGHIHVYNSATPVKTLFDQTWVVNAYGYRVLAVDLPQYKP